MAKRWRRERRKNYCKKIKDKRNVYSDTEEMRKDATYIYKHLDGNEIGKGVFSQALLEKLSEKKSLIIPDYIKKEIIWACGGKSD